MKGGQEGKTSRISVETVNEIETRNRFQKKLVTS